MYIRKTYIANHVAVTCIVVSIPQTALNCVINNICKTVILNISHFVSNNHDIP